MRVARLIHKACSPAMNLFGLLRTYRTISMRALLVLYSNVHTLKILAHTPGEVRSSWSFYQYECTRAGMIRVLLYLYVVSQPLMTHASGLLLLSGSTADSNGARTSNCFGRSEESEAMYIVRMICSSMEHTSTAAAAVYRIIPQGVRHL